MTGNFWLLTLAVSILLLLHLIPVTTDVYVSYVLYEGFTVAF